MNLIGLQTIVRREVSRFLRVPIQTLVSPWINATLYIFIFGFIVGSRIDMISGVPYIKFVLPGVLMLNIITSSFMQSSSSLYFQRFVRYIEEILVSPLSYFEILTGFVSGAILRSVVVALGVYVIALLFGATSIVSLPLFFFMVISVAIFFSLVGVLIGLWADSFEQLSVLNTFVITPLTYLGGMFNSLDMYPASLQKIALLNPFLYFVDGLRYSMIGVSSVNITTSVIMLIVMNTVMALIVLRLLSIGWKIRT